MSKRIVVLGAGLVGRAIARDLAGDYKVLAVDRDADRLEELVREGLETRTANLTESEQLKKVLADCDLVVGALPGYLGFDVLRALLPHVPQIVDISFFAEDPFELNDAAVRHRCTAVVDCGLAPGLSNMALGFEASRWKVDDFRCYVGGLPVERIWPFQYKAPFSPVDVIQEYTRPARVVKRGEIRIREPLSEPELLDIDPVGTLEAFNTDGLRTLLTTLDVPNMHEKTLRYPGHREYLEVLRVSGFLSEEPLEVGGQSVIPREFSSALLFPQWKLDKKDEDITVMWLQLKGNNEDKSVTVNYKLYDRYDSNSAISSMARTTGYTCTAVVRWLLSDPSRVGQGIVPPEILAQQTGFLEHVFEYLTSRGVQLQRFEE